MYSLDFFSSSHGQGTIKHAGTKPCDTHWQESHSRFAYLICRCRRTPDLHVSRGIHWNGLDGWCCSCRRNPCCWNHTASNSQITVMPRNLINALHATMPRSNWNHIWDHTYCPTQYLHVTAPSAMLSEHRKRTYRILLSILLTHVCINNSSV